MPYTLRNRSSYALFQSRQFYFGPAGLTGGLVLIETSLPDTGAPLLEIDMLSAQSNHIAGSTGAGVFSYWGRQWRERAYIRVRLPVASSIRITRVDNTAVPLIQVAVYEGDP